MTENAAPTEADERHADFVRKSHEDVDMRLSLILDLTFGIEDENDTSNVSLTLVTPGGVISGLAVPRKSYEASQISEVADASEAMGAYLTALAEIQDTKLQESAEDWAERTARMGRPLRSFVHFKSATVISGGTNMPVTHLRVKLADVAAWSFNDLSVTN